MRYCGFLLFFVRFCGFRTFLKPPSGCLLQRLRWKDLIAQRQTQEALMMIFKPINNLVLHYLSSMFTEIIEQGYAIKDSASKSHVPLPRTNYLKKSFSYRNLTLWNSLSCDLRQERSFHRFKQFSIKSPYQLS